MSKWSEQGRYDLEETVVTSYDLNKLEKQHKTAFYCFGKNGTIFGKHLIVLGGGAKSKKVDLLRYFWKIDLEKIYFFYFFDLYFCFLKAFFGLKYTS